MCKVLVAGAGHAAKRREDRSFLAYLIAQDITLSPGWYIVSSKLSCCLTFVQISPMTADNYCELPCFYGPLKAEEYAAAAGPNVPDWPPYGTPAMIERVLASQHSWEFALSIPVLEASLSMDTRRVFLITGQ